MDVVAYYSCCIVAVVVGLLIGHRRRGVDSPPVGERKQLPAQRCRLDLVVIGMRFSLILLLFDYPFSRVRAGGAGVVAESSLFVVIECLRQAAGVAAERAAVAAGRVGRAVDAAGAGHRGVRRRAGRLVRLASQAVGRIAGRRHSPARRAGTLPRLAARLRPADDPRRQSDRARWPRPCGRRPPSTTSTRRYSCP